MRYLAWGIALLLTPVSAQSQRGTPGLGGPFYSTGNDQIGGYDEVIAFASAGSRLRTGGVARMTELIFRVHPKNIGGLTVARFDSTNEYNCAAGTWRTVLTVVRDMNNRVVQTLPDDGGAFQRPNPQDTKTPKALTLACGGRLSPDTPMMLTITDVERMVGRYRQSHGQKGGYSFL